MNKVVVANELVLAAEDIIAAEEMARDIRVAEEGGRWMTAEEVRAVCPTCADRMAAMGLSRIRASAIMTSAETFKCPNCGTKVLENTGYCLKCKEKVKKSAETFKCPNCGTKVLENTGYCLKCKEKVKKALGSGSFPIFQSLREVEKILQAMMWDVLHVQMGHPEWADILRRLDSIESVTGEIEDSCMDRMKSLPLAASDMTADYPQNVTEQDRKKWREQGKERRKHEGIHPRKMASEMTAQWDSLPEGWTQKSLKSFWDSLTGDRQHKITACMKKIADTDIDDPGAFCGSLASKMGYR